MQSVRLRKKRGGSACLEVDGEVWPDSYGYEGFGDSRLHGTIEASDFDRVRNLSVADLKPHFSTFTILVEAENEDVTRWWLGEVEINIPATSTDPDVHYPVSFDVEFWACPFSIADLARELESSVQSEPNCSFEFYQEDSEMTANGFGLSLVVPKDSSIAELLDKRYEVTRIVEGVERAFTSRDEALTAWFEFPPAIRTTCEQYLLYFVQFLRDLGINAEAELKEHASRVLFSVTPKDGKEALHQVREALEVYLQIPVDPRFNASAAGFSDVAVAQLQANVLHLQSQVVMAKAALRLQEATINAKDAQIEALRDRLDLRTYLPLAPSNSEKDAEPIIPGVVSVKRHTFKFIEVDFPELLRKLKRRF